MTSEKDKYLVETYPKLYVNRHADMRTTAMCWGFDCNDGWFWLIDNLSKAIQSYIDNNEHLKIPQVVVDQVKEKFGGLRFYYHGGDEMIDGMVRLAEQMSYNICENCGTTENLGRTQGWIRVLCEKCATDNGYIEDWRKNGVEATDD